MTTATLPRHGSRIMRLKIGRAHVVIGLLVLALAIRVIGLTSRPLWLDEGYSLYAVERSWRDLWTIVPSYETHPPFYYSVLKLWSSLFGTGAIALRGLSVLLSLATIPVIVASAFELERQDRSGHALLRVWIAGLLASCSPMLIYLDQQARPYALMIFAYAIAILGLLRLLREFRSGHAGSLASWAMLAAGTELTLWSHNLGILYAFCLALSLAPAWLARPMNPGRLKRGIAAAAVVTLLYLPCLIIAASQARNWGTGWLSWDWFKLLELFALYSVPFELITTASAIAALVMLLLVKRAVQHGLDQAGWTADRALLLLWWGPTLLAIAISALVVPMFLARTLAATLVPAYLALAGAVARSPSPRERLLLGAALSIALVPTALQAVLQPASEKWDEVGAYLEHVVGPGDQVWLYPNDSVLPLREAAPKPGYRIRELPERFPAVAFTGVNRSGSPATPSLTTDQAMAIADDPALRTVPTIWLVTRQIAIFDPNRDFERALSRTRRPGTVVKWGYIEARPYYAK